MTTKQKAWSSSDERYLRRFYATRSLELLGRELRRTPIAVKARASRLHISKGRRYFTPDEDRILEAQYPHRLTEEVAELLGRKTFSVHVRARRLGLRKSAAYVAKLNAELGKRLQRSGAAHRFPKGHVPANKGLRRPGFSIGRGRMRETTFKKGQKPRNLMPIGTIKANSDGYLRVKVSYDRPGLGGSDENWEFLHRRVWEAAHGPIPKGHRIWWKDGKHENCALENLELLKGKEHMARTTIHRMPAELKETIIWQAALKRRLGRIEKRGKQHQGSAKASVRDDRGAQGSGQTDGRPASESHQQRSADDHQLRKAGSTVSPRDGQRRSKRVPHGRGTKRPATARAHTRGTSKRARYGKKSRRGSRG